MSALEKQLMVADYLFFIHVNAQSVSGWNSPVGAVCNRKWLFHNVVFHDVSGVLIAVNDIGQREQYVLGGRRRDAQFTVGMLDDVETLKVNHVAQPLELGQGPDPVGAEAKHIRRPAGDLAIGILHGPQSLVGA